jgi:hypothetical protein
VQGSTLGRDCISVLLGSFFKLTKIIYLNFFNSAMQELLSIAGKWLKAQALCVQFNNEGDVYVSFLELRLSDQLVRSALSYHLIP